MQAKLLRALQERRIYRVGGNTPIPLDVRVLAATNEELLAQVEAGQFRGDLYYRLDEFSIRVPPLRERGQDILFLALGFLQSACEELGKSPLDITSEAAEILKAYSWPGNVRELQNAIERGVILQEGPLLEPEHLPLGAGPRPRTEASGAEGAMNLEEVERQHILRVLRQTGYHQSRAAQILGIGRRTLYRKIREYGIELPEER